MIQVILKWSIYLFTLLLISNCTKQTPACDPPVLPVNLIGSWEDTEKSGNYIFYKNGEGVFTAEEAWELKSGKMEWSAKNDSVWVTVQNSINPAVFHTTHLVNLHNKCDTISFEVFHRPAKKITLKRK